MQHFVNMLLCSVCVKNRIQKLGTGLFTVRSIWCMQFGVRVSICMEAVRLLQVMHSESSVAVWDEMVGDLDICCM